MLPVPSYHVIKDPVHGTMQFTHEENDWIKPFIDSSCFQRLRHIKQLGLGDFVFPGAVHTRFNHCLGSSYVASQISHKIGLAAEERQLVMVAGLLHDIGHGPFSHTFEDVFRDKAIRHEDWTPLFLAQYRTATFFQRYNQLNPRHCLTEEKFLQIENMIMHHSQYQHVLVDIVSSQLDADRLDYLLRDSHFCGVAYGQYDFRWLLHCMAIVKTEQGERLGITHKGIGAVEHYIMARRLMIKNIYHSQKKLGIEYYLIELLRYLAEDLANHRLFAEIRASRLGRFLQNVNLFNQDTAIDSEYKKQQFLVDNFQDYQDLYDYDIWSMIRVLAMMISDHPACELARRIYHRQLPRTFRLESSVLDRAKILLAEATWPSWQVTLIKTPHQAYMEEDPILVVAENGVAKSISEISPMINAISNKSEHIAFLCIDKLILSDKRIRQLIQQLGAEETGHVVE